MSAYAFRDLYLGRITSFPLSVKRRECDQRAKKYCNIREGKYKPLPIDLNHCRKGYFASLGMMARNVRECWKSKASRMLHGDG